MPSIQIVSDLHLETHPSYTTDWHLPQTSRYLALLGDIGHVQNNGLLAFLEEQLLRYHVVFYLLGNHEPYHMRLSAAKERIQGFAARMEKLRLRKTSTMGRFVFLDQTRFDIPDTNITVLGCTLFSHVTTEQALEVQTRFIDFRDIIDWDVLYDHNPAHRSDVEWLNGEVKKISEEEHEPKRHIVIFSHYCPTLDKRAHDPRHSGSTVTSGFATDLSQELCWKSPHVRLWAFGHTHFNCDFVDEISGKQLLANQKGYFRKLPPPAGNSSSSRGQEKAKASYARGTKMPFEAGKTIDLNWS